MYLKPSLVNYGNSLNLIKGNCGWGTENSSMDKTGYYETNWDIWVTRYVHGLGSVTVINECKTTTACRDSDEC